MGKVWDIHRPKKDTTAIVKPTEDDIIAMLWRRGVTIERIFRTYYELEAITDAGYRPPLLTVGDAELAGYASLPPTPTNRQPF